MTGIVAETRTIRVALGPGSIELDAMTGAPVQFIDEADPARRFLLDESSTWHSVEHQWGSGFVITDDVAQRWNVPATLEWTEAGNRARHDLAPGVTLTVERTWDGDRFEETYTFTNATEQAVRLRSIGIQAPFNDVYEGARKALDTSVHAHVWTGGPWSWVVAQPMTGRGRVLGVTVTDGGLQGYSIESRNANTLSNARGHIVLQPSDEGRNPDAMGGQDAVVVPSAGEWRLAWSVQWFADVGSFLAASPAPAELPHLSAAVGQELTVATDQAVECDDTAIRPVPGGAAISALNAGIRTVRLGSGARTDVLFHDPVETIVRERVEYILRFQTTRERPGTLAHALVPVNTVTRLTQSTNGWSDWTDGSERIAMAILVQQARSRGLVGTEVDGALAGWSAFAREHLLDESFAPRRGSQDHHTGPRLYDAPWLAIFFVTRAASLAAESPDDSAAELDLAARVLERAFELGAERFLAILQAEAVALVADALAAARDVERAAALRARLLSSARQFADANRDLPAHEVAYEQTIVGPLVSLLSEAFRMTGDRSLLPLIEERVDWLLAFGGPQPHVRLRDIAIRHWDGYWFGQRRQWGDIFPHYWSSLTALALLRLPAELLTAERRTRAEAILAANLVNFGRAGWATCAFVFPSTVDSEPASQADPLANDQDWHLVMWLLLNDWGLAELA